MLLGQPGGMFPGLYMHLQATFEQPFEQTAQLQTLLSGQSAPTGGYDASQATDHPLLQGPSLLKRQADGASKPSALDMAKYKTSICKMYDGPGGCRFGDKCVFAHGADELRTKVSGVSGGVSGNRPVYADYSASSFAEAPTFGVGIGPAAGPPVAVAPHGDSMGNIGACAAGQILSGTAGSGLDAPLAKRPALTPTLPTGDMVAGPVMPQPPSAKMDSSRYKTSLCKTFDQPGGCRFGDQCAFAHGHGELRAKGSGIYLAPSY